MRGTLCRGSDKLIIRRLFESFSLPGLKSISEPRRLKSQATSSSIFTTIPASFFFFSFSRSEEILSSNGWPIHHSWISKNTNKRKVDIYWTYQNTSIREGTPYSWAMQVYQPPILHLRGFCWVIQALTLSVLEQTWEIARQLRKAYF